MTQEPNRSALNASDPAAEAPRAFAAARNKDARQQGTVGRTPRPSAGKVAIRALHGLGLFGVAVVSTTLIAFNVAKNLDPHPAPADPATWENNMARHSAFYGAGHKALNLGIYAIGPGEMEEMLREDPVYGAVLSPEWRPFVSGYSANAVSAYRSDAYRRASDDILPEKGLGAFLGTHRPSEETLFDGDRLHEIAGAIAAYTREIDVCMTQGTGSADAVHKQCVEATRPVEERIGWRQADTDGTPAEDKR